MQTQAVAPVSNTCSYAVGNVVYWITRHDTCRIIRSGINLADARTGAIVGSTVFDMYFFGYNTSSSGTWEHQVEIQGISQTANMVGTKVQAFTRCSGTCLNPSTRFPYQPIGSGIEAEGDAFFDSATAASGSISNGSTQWGFQFSIPGASPNPSAIYYDEYNPYTYVVRCDRATPGRGVGCAFSAYVPTVIYSRAASSDVFELARHIGDAQASGLPGAYPNGPTLTRLLTGDDSIDNRNRACPAGYTRPASKSCDEYPFASSNQGASTKPGPGRTFNYCQIPQLPVGVTGATGYSSCMINATQNSVGGSRLSSFYGENRVISNDPYRVWIQN